MTTLILTHEQADFDAVASVWAAYRLHPAAVPVLPRRLNRNVRAFMTLYGGQFSFIESADLARQKVDKVIIVDAQAVSSVKGMSPRTETLIIDHHAGDGPVGANTTLLVEQLAEAGAVITPVEATLFLLGLYEDTGSLTYRTTTPRDARAVALLLEAGAQLDTAREFMQQPLTAGQNALLNQLIASAETHTIKGQVIVVTAGGGGADEELSGLAHKLRDTFDAAAVFMLVALAGHDTRVQLIARSTTNDVDVASAARRFGGGGHSRAAAALVRNRPLAEVKAALLESLPEYVRPAVAVAEIMSRGVQTFEPGAAIRAAGERMRRYGHEGYPVVAGGRIVGLVTRRAVDRALHHGLDAQAITTIMEMGEVFVAPGDSLEHLQRIMTAHGWGQVPVVENNEVIGVVTRTDLLKRLSAPARPSERLNLAERLSETLPEEQLLLLRQISGRAAELNLSIFIVGGFVRDLILGQPAGDFDLVVEGDAVALARRVAAALGGRIVSHPRFGTAKWKLPPNAPLRHLDFVSARTEFYAHPSALPEVEHANIKLDLHRRDFTINTLALCLDRSRFGDVLDFWGGQHDLQDGVIRVLHSISFVDDATRMLRAVRFEQRFDFRIEPRTAELIGHALPLLKRVSGDRLRHELDLILAEAEPARHLARLSQLGILSSIQPALSADGELARRAALLKAHAGAAQDPRASLWTAWLTTLPAASLDSVIVRLNLPARLADMLRQVAGLLHTFQALNPGQSFGELHQALAAYDSESLDLAVALCGDAALQARLRAYTVRNTASKPVTTGEDLKALGLPPGPRYGRLLGRLRRAYLDGEIDSPEAERALLARLLEGQLDRT
jgi:tRNA nucleotidyltransferase (CCA-adding enzyme)